MNDLQENPGAVAGEAPSKNPAGGPLGPVGASVGTLLSYEQAAQVLTLQGLPMSVRTLQRHVSAGTLRVIRLGHRTVRIRAVELEKFKQRHEK